MLPKHWTHGKSIKKTMLTFVVCLIFFFLLKLHFGLFQNFLKWLWWQPKRPEGFPLQNWTPRERQPWLSCLMHSMYLTKYIYLFDTNLHKELLEQNTLSSASNIYSYWLKTFVLVMHFNIQNQIVHRRTIPILLE